MTHSFDNFAKMPDTLKSVVSKKKFQKKFFLSSYNFLTVEGGKISPNKIEKYGNFEMKLERVNEQ